jgi:DNA-binding beta-propeller fold protein YncE
MYNRAEPAHRFSPFVQDSMVSCTLLLSLLPLFYLPVFWEAAELRSFGSFGYASSVALEPGGEIIATDREGNRVYKFNSEGKPLSDIGGYGWGQLEFDQPYGVATNGLDVFVADNGNHRVQRFNRKLEYISTLFTRDNSDESQRFGYPVAVAVNRFGDLLVCERENNRVLKISGFQRVTRSIGGIDAGKGRLNDPLQVEIGPNDETYVLEKTRIVVFDHFGNYLRTVGRGMLRSASGLGVFRSSVFVADSNRVIELTTDGKFLQEMEVSSIIIDQPTSPCVDVAADAGRLVVLFPRFGIIVPRTN